MDGFVFLTNNEHWKPFAGGALVVQYFNFDLQEYIPGLVDATTSNHSLQIQHRTTAGFVLYFNDNRLMTKAEQQWGWVVRRRACEKLITGLILWQESRLFFETQQRSPKAAAVSFQLTFLIKELHLPGSNHLAVNHNEY